MSRSSLVPGGLRALGALSLGLGVWMAVSPGTFFDALGPFGERNDHYLRDAATWNVALGVTALLAASRPRWHLPVLAFAAVQNGLHAVNHLVDVGDADPGWIGVLDLVLLAAITVALVALLRGPASEDVTPAEGRP